MTVNDAIEELKAYAERRNNRLRAFAESGLIDGLAVRNTE